MNINRDVKKMRVLQFPIANSKGGITQYVLQNWRFIDKSKFQFDFATMSKSLDFADELLKDGCKIFYISCYAEDDEKKFIEEFRKILINGNYDIVHLHTKQWKSFNVEKIAKEVGIKKVIVHAHSTGIDTLDESKRKKEIELHDQMLKKLTEDIATDFWACSELAADFLFNGKIVVDEIKIMKNAIDLSKFRFNNQVRNEYRKKLRINGKFVIGNIGRLAYPKNHEFLLKVFIEICKLDKSCLLLLVGTGEKEEEYKKYVKENDIMNKVIFLGHRTDANCLLQAMDVFVLPSKFEGFPIVAVEAQMAGLKCVCSNTITSEVTITENINMLPLEVELWRDEILKLKNGYERKDMSDKLKAAGYDIHSQIKNIEDGYLKNSNK